MKVIMVKVENIAGMGENAGYKHFLLFQQCFQRTSLAGLLKTRNCFSKDKKGNSLGLACYLCDQVGEIDAMKKPPDFKSFPN